MKPIAISAIHQFHEKNNAILTQVNGWMMPKRYASVEDELGIIENFVGIHDISPKAKLIVHGDGFFGVLSEKFEVISELNHKAMFMRSFKYGFELILATLTNNQYLIITDPEFKNAVTEICDRSNFVDISSGLTGIRLIGPKARDIIYGISSFDVRDKNFPDLSVAQISVMHQHAYLLRMDIQDKLCYDIFIAREIGLFVWNQIMIVGNSLGIAPIGTELMDGIVTDGVAP